MNSPSIVRHTHIVRLTALVCLLAGIPVLAQAGAVQAAGVVTDCSNDSDLQAKVAGGGLVTFNCLLPAPIIITVTSNGGILPLSATTIDGSNHGNPITLSGGGTTRLFHHIVLAGALSLTHLTLRDGNAGSDNGGCLDNEGGYVVLTDVTLARCTVAAGHSGGGVYNSGSATLNNATLSGNSSNGSGGGIYNSGTTTLNNSTLSGNSAIDSGGGIFNSSGTTTLNESTLNGNSSSDGGAIFNDFNGTMTLNNSTLSGNTANNSDGGGMLNRGIANLNESTLSGNSASYGGGIFNFFSATVIVKNSTLSGNLAITGGGIYNYIHGTAILNSSTLSSNSATVSGGALFMASGMTTVLTNTILAYSPAGGNCDGTITASTFTIASDNSCALPAANTIRGMNPNGLDPLLTGLGHYGGPTLVHMLKAGSPAIDGVVGFPSFSTDQRGQPRSPDIFYDVGSVERQPTDSNLAPRLYLPLTRR